MYKLSSCLFMVPVVLLTVGCRRLTSSFDHNGTNKAALPQVFVFAGQSNMPGADASDPVPPNPRVLMYGLDRQIELAADPMWNVATSKEPVMTDNNEEFYGVSPAHFFGVDILSKIPQANVILVPCARGATAMDEWLPGTPLYQTMVRRTHEALAQSGGQLSGLFFWQGEDDYVDMDHATSWAQKFTSMASAFRSEFGNVPVIYVQIASDPNNPIREILRQNQAAAQLSNCRMINAEDLGPRRGDDFYTPGYAIMGQRMADAMRGLWIND